MLCSQHAIIKQHVPLKPPDQFNAHRNDISISDPSHCCLYLLTFSKPV